MKVHITEEIIVMKKAEGFSLLEVMLASTILFIGIATIMSVLSTSFTANAVTEGKIKSILVIAHEAERLKAADLLTLEAEFSPTFTLTSYFAVEGFIAYENDTNTLLVQNPPPPPYPPYLGAWSPLLNPPFEDGRPPAQGKITATLPTGNASELVEFTIRIDYISDLGEWEIEMVTIWVSPTY